MIKKVIVELINQEFQAANQPFYGISIATSLFGDYSTSFPLKLDKFKDYQTPEQIAKYFVSRMQKNELFSEVTFTEPGFINFVINQKEAAKYLREVIGQADEYGFNKNHQGKKARVEFVSANPTGPLHVGNARGGPLGSSLASILAANGYSVIQEYLHNNIGSQIKNLGQSLLNLKNGQLLEDQEYKGEYLLELVHNLPADLVSPEAAGSWASEQMLKEILADLEKIGIKYNKIYQESYFEREKTRDILSELESKQLLKKSEGASWFAPNDSYMKDREAVVIRSDGQPTYFANDIAYHNEKFSEGYDLVIDELGSGHDGHIPKLKAAISALDFDVNKFKVIVHQNVRVRRGKEVVKMSKRAGNYVTAREVIDEVGKDAFRFLLLMKSPNTHLDFDLDQAKKQTSENPVYYVQYAHARICSLLAKTDQENYHFDPSLLITQDEKQLTLKILEFPDLVSEVGENFLVHHLTQYAMELSDLFHKLYEKERILDQDPELTKARLALVKAAQIVLKNNLNLLGVSAPEKM